MADANTALVTGATGALGPILVNALLAGGKRVRVVSRRPIPGGYFSSPVETVVGDIADPQTAASAAADIDVVFHLAAMLHIPKPPASLRAEYERVNVMGTRLMIENAQKAGVKRVVFFSTIAVYGATPGTMADETTLPRPDTFYAETKLMAEEFALAARRDSGEPLACVLRVAATYGPRMKGNYRRLARALARGWFAPIGDGSNRRTLIHEHDAAAAALLAAGHPLAPGKIFNVTDGEVYSVKEILDAMCAGLGRRPIAWHVPINWIQPGVKFADALMQLAGRNGLALAMLNKYIEDVAVSGAKFQRELGFRPRYGLLSGWRQTLDEMKLSGQL